MKKIIIIASLIFLFIEIGNAQITKGSFLLEPKINFSLEELFEEDTESDLLNPMPERIETNFEASLNIGYALCDNLVISLLTGHSSLTIETDYPEVDPSIFENSGFVSITGRTEYKNKFSTISFGVNLSKYIILSDNFYFVVGLSMRHENFKNIFDYKNNDIVYENNESTSIAIIRDGEITFIEIPNSNVNASYNEDVQIISKYYSFELAGTLHYQLTPWLGIQAKVASGDFRFNYKHISPENSIHRSLSNRSESNISLNPVNMRFGVVFQI